MTRPARTLAVATAMAGAIALAGCGSAGSSGQTGGSTGASVVTGCVTTPPTTPAAPKTYSAPPPMTIDATKQYWATMRTSCGVIRIKLDAKAAPNTVNNFVFLARQGFYNGLTFHRVVKDFVIQGGDPKGNGSGGPGYEFADELPPQAGYQVGSVAMANSGPDTNGSQFFIVTGINGEQLPNQYSRFGTVYQSIQVAKRIESLAPNVAADNPSAQVPRQTVWIYSVKITAT
ncbi:MAG: peptidylprolyl isomerase [Thermoleophilia bacterium]